MGVLPPWIFLALAFLAAIHPALNQEELLYQDIGVPAHKLVPPNQPHYLAIASRTIRPGQVYRVTVSLLPAGGSIESVLVRASLHRGLLQLAADSQTLVPGDSHTLLMQVPSSLKEEGSRFYLKMEGSSNGGILFSNETELTFSQRFLTILIQTNQLVYNMELPINIRVILLTTEMKGFADPVDVFLVNSEGFVMKRWISVYPNLGFVSLTFTLPYDYPQGWWTVRVVALGQVEEKKILVERWFTHRYDVNVGLPAFIMATSETLEGSVLANYTQVARVVGNATIRAYVRDRFSTQSTTPWDRRYYLEQFVLRFNGYHEFSFSLSDLARIAAPTPLHSCEVMVEVDVGERFFDIVIRGYSKTRIIRANVALQFVGPSPQVFRPGLPFRTQIGVSYDDLVQLEPEKLERARLEVQPVVQRWDATQTGGGSQTLQFVSPLLDEWGVAEVEVDTPTDAERILLRVRYDDGEDTANAELLLLSYVSQSSRHMRIMSSTKVAKAGEYAVFHVWGNFYMDNFNYVISSKGIILETDTVKVQGQTRSVTTFAVAVSPEMSPNLRALVYVVAKDGEVIADSMALPVLAFNRDASTFPFTVYVNLNQDRTNNLVEFIPKYATESIVAISSCDSDMLSTQARSDLTPSSVLEEMYRFEEDHLSLHKLLWRNREGEADTVRYFHSPSIGRTTNQTFEFAGMATFTNLHVTDLPNMCNASVGYQSCRNGQCYLAIKRCDGVRDCEDGTDEGNCEEEMAPDLFDFYLYRRNRFNPFFDSTGGNFAWKDVLLGHQAMEFVPAEVPQGPSVYVIRAIAMNREHGLAILEQPVLHDSTKPFIMTYECPETALLGEQIGIRLVLFNFQHFEIQAEVILESSEDYRFIQVESMGIVSSYSPRTGTGELQHLVYIMPQSEVVVYLPIVATRTGDIEVHLIGRTQAALENHVIPMKILSDAVEVSLHTSILLDMRTESYMLRFLNINVTEDPIIPLEDTYRLYIFGSPKASVSIIGDVVGVPLPVDEQYVSPMDLGYSEAVKSGEHILFDFAYNLHTLVYLRLTNQLDPTTTRLTLEHLNKAYVYSMMYFKNGAFTMFGTEPSTWLTAYAARLLWLAQYTDWENYFYVDSKYISQSIDFLLRHQTPRGSFYEPRGFHAWNSKLDMPSSQWRGYARSYNISLTAHVLITLHEIQSFPGAQRAHISSARSLATRYLEDHLPLLEDPYQVALVTYTLSLVGSVEAERGFQILEETKREADGMVYWSPDPIPATRVIYYNQRPFIQPRLPRPYDAMAVEATSYALMVYIRFGGVYQDSIVKWLNSMRMHDPGFIATQDTIVAIQALTEYSFRTNTREISFVKLSVESSANAGKMHTMSITPETLAIKRKVEIGPNVWGHVEAVAQGAGMAVLQLDVRYNVDRAYLLVPPPETAFNLTVEAYYHGRNKSHINFVACAKWLLTKHSDYSGLAVMDISIPTGYYAYRPILQEYVARGQVPGLQRARVYPKSAVFMFDYLTTRWTCVNFTVERWFPVANLTRFLKAKVYDYYMPERFKEIIYEAYPLYVLNICEVCGSYQCPYCPFFSGALSLQGRQGLVLWASLLALLLRVRLGLDPNG